MIDTTHHELLSEREVSDWLGLSEPTLFRHRRDGTGPRFIRLSERRIAYRRTAVEEWLSAREQLTLDSCPDNPVTGRNQQNGRTTVLDTPRKPDPIGPRTGDLPPR